MAEFLSPGIFIEEVNTSGQQVDAVGTSTMSTVGWTERGPVDTATVVTSVDDFQRKFGEYTNDSRVPITVQAFFFNGGSRAYVVRVVPTDSVAGESCITDQITGEAMSPVGTGSSPQTITATLANIPVQKGSVVVSWRNNPAGSITGENPAFAPAEGPTAVGPHLATLASTPIINTALTINWTESVQASGTLTVSAGPIVDGDTVTVGATTYTFKSPFVDAANNVFIGGSDTAALNNLVSAITGGAGAGTTYGTGTVANASASAMVTSPGLTVLVWAILGGTAGNSVATTTTGGTMTFGAVTLLGGTDNDAKTATLTSPSTVGGTNASRISAASINLATGALSITFNARTIGTDNGPDTNSITIDYDVGGALQTVTDNGAGAFSATTTGSTIITGTVNYTTGAVSVTFTGGTDQPYAGNLVVADYKHCQWELAASNPGSWSSRLTMRVAGNVNYFTYGTQAVAGAGEYSKFDVTVLLENTLTGENEVKETYEEVVFNDATDAIYFPDVLNDNSDFIAVTDSGTLDVPATFKGIDRTAVVMGTGDGTTTLFTGTLANAPIVKTSVVITYTSVSSSTRTLVADVSGNITGTGLDTTKTNSVNYTTGVFTLNFLTTPDCPAAASSITADYISMPTTSSVDYVFTGGADGTLTGPTFDRTVFTSPVLAANKRGMYALGKIDEVMQLVIPDFAGDTTVAGDQLDYAESRKDIFVILTTPKGMDSQDAADYRSITFNRKSKFAAMYWPWIKVTDPLNAAKTLTIPSLGWIAGVYARTDQSKNVGKAPGGTIDGALRFLSGLESDPDKGDRDLVYPLRVNPLINTTQTGLAVWGVRTLSATNDVLRYVNAVRLFQFVEKSIFNSTFNFVFESISSNLYGQIKSTVDSFLLNLYTTGHFAGNSPTQAFFVICDETNNPPEVANAGQVVVDIGIAPNRPGEFIRFRFSQKTLTA
jgi:phage tail sheath protein FI